MHLAEDSMGMRIRLARVRRNVTQIELARLVGISKNCMNQIETNQVDPRASSIKAMAEVLGVSNDYLLAGREPAYV